MAFRRLPLINSPLRTLVDEADFERVRHRRWRMARDGYVVSGGGRSIVYLHRLIIGTPAGLDTDHRNGRRLDNRRSNLRACRRGQNNANARRGRRRSRTGYRGVHVTARGRYRAQIGVDGRLLSLGTYRRAVDAARAYDVAARLYYGQYARTNFSPEGRRLRW